MRTTIPATFFFSTATLLLAFCNHSQATINTTKLYDNAQKAGLSHKVLKTALTSYEWAKEHNKVTNPNVLTVVDYSKPSTAKRLWVFNLKSGKVMLNTYVAHASSSGVQYAKHFSNSFHSHMSSLGVYVTDNRPYYGKHGRSLRVHGLESGVNDNAFRRMVEIHGANYVSKSAIQKYGRIGRTWGCFGVNPHVARQLVDDTVGGSVLFAYAPEEDNDTIIKG